MAWTTTRSPRAWTRGARWSASGASASSRSDWRASKRELARVALGSFPPELTVEIKALACELPANLGLPLSRLSVADVARHAERSGLVARISDSTVWRWLHEDAIRPWQHRCWIFPRDPHFQAKAGRGDYATLVTSGFVHADLAHLVFNSFTFWAFGFGL